MFAAHSALHNQTLATTAIKRVVQVGTGAEIDAATLSAVKTLLFREIPAGNMDFCKQWARTETKALGAAAAEPLGALASGCPQLAEIYYCSPSGRSMAMPMDLVFDAMLKLAPHLSTTLKLLRLQINEVAPADLKPLRGFKALERLDLSNLFTTEYYDFDQSP